MGKPKIRFKGFDNDWEQRKLENFGKATGGTSIESEFSEEGVYKVISIGSYSENSLYNDQGIRAIKSDKTSNRVLSRNDLTMILNDKTTSGNIIGRVLLIEESGIYVYNQRTERIEINVDEYAPVFLYEMLNAPNIREKIIKQAQGNTQIYVNWSTISLLDYMIPSKEEQVKIGEYLHNLSNLITLHQRKCEDTKKLKKYMLQKMFPQNGSKVPEIRFKGFTDDWEQRKFSDIAETRRGLTYKPTNIVDNGIRVLRSSNINEDTFVYGNDDVFVDENVVNIPCVQNGDILITSANGSSRLVGKHAIIRNLHDNSAVHGGFMLIASSSNSEFLNASMGSQWYSEFLSLYVAGGNGAIGNLNKNDLDMQVVFVPRAAEQCQIGTYFRTLDHLITLHQNKCDELKKIKKYMLQNMFV